MSATAEKCHGDLTVRDYEELLRASNILHRVATMKNSAALRLVADFVMLHLSADDAPIRGESLSPLADVAITPPIAERLAELEAFVAKLRACSSCDDDRDIGLSRHRVGVTMGELRRVKR